MLIFLLYFNMLHVFVMCDYTKSSRDTVIKELY